MDLAAVAGVFFVVSLVGFGALGLSTLRQLFAGDFVRIDLTDPVDDPR